MEIVAEENYSRLDVFLCDELGLSRSQVQRLIKNKNITCYINANENITRSIKLKPSMKVLRGEKFFVEIPPSENLTHLEAENINFEVVYEDEYLLVINKPAGLVVHPAPGNWHGTLVNGLVYRYPELKNLPNFLRPGIVHRLDAGTSGLMIVARTQKVTLMLQEMLKLREVHKKYIALAHGSPAKHEGILSGPIDRDPNNFMRMAIIENGRPSLTGYKVLWSMNKFSLIECNLFTGRMHQIRVHLSALGCPLVGDNLYGTNDENLPRVYLHSWKLDFTHPVTGENMNFRQNITQDFIDIISRLAKQS
ncbi:MAG: RluA family pseudouridine synthase [Synergistaceae bacterium]|nr:RluA family pseudouridine synthase [Synergistaceae bacterium]